MNNTALIRLSQNVGFNRYKLNRFDEEDDNIWLYFSNGNVELLTGEETARFRNWFEMYGQREVVTQTTVLWVDIFKFTFNKYGLVYWRFEGDSVYIAFEGDVIMLAGGDADMFRAWLSQSSTEAPITHQPALFGKFRGGGA